MKITHSVTKFTGPTHGLNSPPHDDLTYTSYCIEGFNPMATYGALEFVASPLPVGTPVRIGRAATYQAVSLPPAVHEIIAESEVALKTIKDVGSGQVTSNTETESKATS